MGCTAGLDGGTRRGARRKAAAKKASTTPKSYPKPSEGSPSKTAGISRKPSTDGSPANTATKPVGDASRIVI